MGIIVHRHRAYICVTLRAPTSDYWEWKIGNTLVSCCFPLTISATGRENWIWVPEDLGFWSVSNVDKLAKLLQHPCSFCCSNQFSSNMRALSFLDSERKPRPCWLGSVYERRDLLKVATGYPPLERTNAAAVKIKVKVSSSNFRK